MVMMMMMRARSAPRNAGAAPATSGSGSGSGSGRGRGEAPRRRRCAATAGDGGVGRDTGATLRWRRIATLETNVDDCSPQVIAFAQERLMDAGALDCYTSPIGMKKVGR